MGNVWKFDELTGLPNDVKWGEHQGGAVVVIRRGVKRKAGDVVEKRVCKRCGEHKDVVEYAVCNKSKDGLSNVCNDCRKPMGRHKGGDRDYGLVKADSVILTELDELDASRIDARGIEPGIEKHRVLDELVKGREVVDVSVPDNATLIRKELVEFAISKQYSEMSLQRVENGWVVTMDGDIYVVVEGRDVERIVGGLMMRLDVIRAKGE